ncbi:hypothetical protein Dsin_002665 [Dipteronia sinensis]|uniref:BZIP domain-containing protein n=1 Tax=Dipteronia sinensis TaxID=43782 RepID=A0AAE0EJW6_9ROSI|nr:hypothetical protein Dsin_002665 [Dipteronia sinensis]
MVVSPNRAHDDHYDHHDLGRQGSVYNLTVDQVESQLINNIGKPLNAMNLDELLKNVISFDQETHHHHQLLQNPTNSSSSSSSSPPPPPLGNINLNGTSLSKKTVDEVWKEIVHHEGVNEVDKRPLGETTLEDFLMPAGVINLGADQDQNHHHNHMPFMDIDPMVVVSQQENWLQYQMTAAAHQQHQMTLINTNFNDNPVADNIGYSDKNNQLAMSMPMPALSQSKATGHLPAKRRYSDEMMEKTIERRQKRMIKNRESAARSRARKQAYTNQLELEVLQLRKTNGWLKKQKQEVEMLLSSYPILQSRYQLRRTSSAQL